MLRALIYIVGGAAVLFGSFFITLWLTEPDTAAPPMPPDGRSRLERLTTQRISSYAQLTDDAANVGLKFSRRLQGNIDGINHVSDHEASIGGWLADPGGNGTPLHVVVFVRGAMVANVETKGERKDVTQAIHLGFGAEKNVAFFFKFNCTPGAQPVVAGVDDKGGQYMPLIIGRCP